MPFHLSRTVRATAVTATAALLLGAAPAAVAAPASTALTWRPCADAPTTDCATLRVPLDWAQPHGATIELALARHRATDPSRRIGPLVVNPGGPGGSGVDFVKQADDPHGYGAGMFSADLRARFDLVGWDPRGVGGSSPVRCDAGLLADPPSPYPASAAEFTALTAYDRKLVDNCRDETGPVFDHLDTASTARDVEAIRVALDEGGLSFYAMSYGTQIGEQYAELFPHRVRVMALDSTMDHSAGALLNATTLAEALEDSYAQFAGWCAATPSCPLQPADPTTVLDDLYRRAQNGTLRVPEAPDRVVTPDLLLDYLRGKLMGVGTWVSLARELRAVRDEPDAPAPPAGSDAGSPRTPADLAEAFITCEDHDWGVTTFDQLQQLETAMEAVAPHTHFSTTAVNEVTQCLGWPAPIGNPQRPLAVPGRPSVFIVNSRYDVATPYPGALRVLHQIGPAAVLMTYAGTSHADYSETPCVQTAIDTYLITRHRPSPASQCPAVFPT
jgi:pimeloyl-ACP methyl ester carboxylesterase